VLIDYIAVLNGQEIRYSDAASTASINEKTVKNYLEILKETFLIIILRPFYTDKLKEVRKVPKIYFPDNGVRNNFIRNFNPPHLREDTPFLLEASVFPSL